GISLRPKYWSEQPSCSDPIWRYGKASGNCACLRRPSRSRFGAQALRVASNIATNTCATTWAGAWRRCRERNSSMSFILKIGRYFARDGRPHWQAPACSRSRRECAERMGFIAGSLCAAFRSVPKMAASIAHELNQPLTAVVTHAYACREWLQSEPANLEKASATAEKIVQESTRASVVVSRVRALFRKEAQVRELASINRLIRELARLLRDEAIRRDVSIRLELTDDLPQLEMDPVQIQQVLLNLAINGMDAMTRVAAPRELIIRSKKHDDGEILVVVEDHGSGIAPAFASRMFEPFFSTKPDGTGMGLAICRSIIEAHDGRL